MRSPRSLAVALFVIFLLTGGQAAFGQKGALKIDYTVSLADPSKPEFHVATTISNINQPQFSVALPTWTPGWYTVENYFKNVLRFRITDASGRVLPMRMTRKQTWTIDTKGIKEIKVDYDYRATVLALNQAKITKDFAFFTGVELFLEPVGHKDDPSTVHFSIPSGWKIASALKETSDPMVFTADNYDVLVDAPTELGNFDVTKYEVEGKPHYFVSNPAGTFTQEKANAFTEMMAKVARSDSAMFGGLPYDKYVMFYFFSPAESNASGALEHLNSFVAFAFSPTRTPDQIIGTAAHEYFHLWNVKRIRPAEMWPYDYSRENETPLLWVSEGFTNYYGVVSRFRAGLMTPENFLAAAAGAAAGVEGSEERNYISPANSSVSTWVGYDTPVAFGISYYTQGQNLGALLDLSIRNDTNGGKSLDDVMRYLFNEHYKKGRGFSTEDMVAAIKKVTGKDYQDFYDKYVWGTDVPDYNRIFGYAGYSFDKSTTQAADLGFAFRFRNDGLTVNGITPGSGAATAGLRVGDVVTKIDGTSIASLGGIDQLAGKTVNFSITRGGESLEIPIKVGTRDVPNYKLNSVATPTARQLKVRSGWLKQG